MAILIAAHLSAAKIHDYAKAGKLKEIKTLLGKKMKLLDSQDKQGFTPLNWAAIRAEWETAEFLLSKGANPNTPAKDGSTPFHSAAYYNHPPTITLILSKGGDLKLKNKAGNTVLHIAAMRNCKDVVELLLSKGARPNVNTPNKIGRTPLHLAYRSGHPRVIRLLLNSGASPNLKDKSGKKPADHKFLRPAPQPSKEDQLKTYCGEYQVKKGPLFKIWLKDRMLWIQNQTTDELYPTAPDTFHGIRNPWIVKFTKNKKSQITGIQIKTPDHTLKGHRIKIR